MPNPFVRIGTQGRKPTEYAKPKPLTPVMDEPKGEVYAYRGMENHGVASDGTDDEALNSGPDTKAAILYDKPPKDDYLGAVRIVPSTDSRDFKRFRTDRQSVDGAIRQLVGRNDERTSVKISNMSSDKTLWIAEDPANVEITGYPLGPGKEFTTSAEDAVYAKSVDGTVVTVGILVEYTTHG